MRMKHRTMAFAVAAVLLSGAATAMPMVVLEEDFEDGNTTGWDVSLSSGSSSFTAINDGTLGMAARLGSASNNQTFQFAGINFAEQTLANVGDTLSLTFDLRWLATPDTSGSALRFGLWDSNGDVSSDGGENYWSKISTNAGASSANALFEEPGAPGFFTGHAVLNTAGSGALITDTEAYAADLILALTAGGVQLSSTIFDTDGVTPLGTVSALDTSTLITSFDAVGIRTPLDSPIAFDNIFVTFTPAPQEEPETAPVVPEPATLGLALLGGAALLPRRSRRGRDAAR